MRLTRVCVWSPDGWKNITAEEFAAQHPNVGSISATKEYFWCEICGQYVTYAKGDIYAPHFRHSSTYENKTCEQRAQNFYGDWARSDEPPKQITSPIVICVGQNNFHFERDDERLSDRIIARELNDDGTLFKLNGGRLLPFDSDVRINQKYYLLTTKAINAPGDIVCKRITTKYVGGDLRTLYEIEATALTEAAAKFFLHCHYRLTENPIALRMIFPIGTIEPHFVRHDAQHVFVYVLGSARTIGFYPKKRPPIDLSRTSVKLLKVECASKQLIVAGRAQPLEALNLSRGFSTVESKPPTVNVTDVLNNPITDGVSSVLPKDRLIRVLADFDGYVTIERNGSIANKIVIKAGEMLTVDVIGFGAEIKIFQGLDCMRTLQYERAKKKFSASDEELYRRLARGRGRPIAIQHAWGRFVDELSDYPKVQAWLYQKIRAGHAPEESHKIFRRLMLDGRLM